MDKKRYGSSFLIVTLLSGVALGVVAGFSVYAVIIDNQELKVLMHRWQSLVAGVLAFIASFMLFCSAIYGGFTKKRSQLLSARAFLPQSLVKISDYLEQAAAFLAAEYCTSVVSASTAQRKILEKPVFPIDAFADFRVLVEASDKRLALVIARLITDLQILDSRIKVVGTAEYLKPLVGKQHGYEIVAILFIETVLARFYDYSREAGDFNFNSIEPYAMESNLGKLSRKVKEFDLCYDDLVEGLKTAIEARTPETGFFLAKDPS